MSYAHTRSRALQELRARVADAVEAMAQDEDALMRATPADVAASIDLADLADAVVGLLEEMAEDPLGDAQACLLCPRCGSWTEPTAHETGDPADERRRCVDERCGEVVS